MLCSYLKFCFQREEISSSTKVWTIQFPTVCFLYSHWNVSWGPRAAEHAVWLQDVTGETRGQLCILTPANFHLVLLLYSSQMKSPSWGLLLGQAGPAPNQIHSLTEVGVSLLLSLELSLVTCCCQKRLLKGCWWGSTKLMARPRH